MFTCKKAWGSPEAPQPGNYRALLGTHARQPCHLSLKCDSATPLLWAPGEWIFLSLSFLTYKMGMKTDHRAIVRAVRSCMKAWGTMVATALGTADKVARPHLQRPHALRAMFFPRCHIFRCEISKWHEQKHQMRSVAQFRTLFFPQTIVHGQEEGDTSVCSFPLGFGVWLLTRWWLFWRIPLEAQ